MPSTGTPNSRVTATGDMTAGGSGCQELVGNDIQLTGNSTVSVSGCGAVGTPQIYSQVIQLAE